MWELIYSADYEKRVKRFVKTNRQEILNVTDNLAAFLAALNEGLKPQQISRGFIHDEPLGIKALDESGPGKHKKALRLYVYPDENTNTLRILTLGDKTTQRQDIQVASNTVKALLNTYLKENETDY